MVGSHYSGLHIVFSHSGPLICHPLSQWDTFYLVALYLSVNLVLFYILWVYTRLEVDWWLDLSCTNYVIICYQHAAGEICSIIPILGSGVGLPEATDRKQHSHWLTEVYPPSGLSIGSFLEGTGGGREGGSATITLMWYFSQLFCTIGTLL